MVVPAHVTIGHTDMDHLPDLAQRMPGGDEGLKIDIAEQRTARLVRPTHHHTHRYRATSDSCSENRVESRLFQ